MGTEAASWADQWSEGGVEHHGTRSQKYTNTNKKKNSSLEKVKAAARIGVQKIKIGASICVTWIKNQLKKKRTSK
uniref:Uncharacterized protein n=1 Tax=Cajanus cajan TaxID=3821 RepID=A0A151T6Y1_CAJCA|nr:hypothetical protein KK1_017324 [Cajanus cajan]